MKNFFTLLNREVNSYFYSPIAYVVLCYFLFLMGLNTWLMIAGANNNAIDVTQGTLVQSFFSGAIFWYPFILIFPLITMRVFAEEFRMGTIETLTTAPVDDGAIVLSKYVGATLFSCLLFIPSLLFYALFSWVGGHGTASFGGPYLVKAIAAVSHWIGGSGEATTNATGAYWTTYLLILLMTMFYCSIGCLASALTKDQINAAIISFSTGVVLLFIGFFPQIVDLSGYVSMDDARKAQAYILPLAHMADYSKGIIDSRPLVYYLSMTLFVIYLTYQVFQHRKWSDGGYPIFLVLGWLLLTSVALLAIVFWHPMVAFLKERPVIIASVGGVVVIAIALAIFTGSRKTFIRANVLIQLGVLTFIVLAANFLSFRHFKRWDFSRDKQYALSQQTKNVLAGLQKPVHAISYFSTAAEILKDVDNLLVEYDYASNKKFLVEAVDPYKNLSRAEELKNKYKIQDRDNVIILDYEGKTKFINAQDMVEMEQQDQMAQMTGQPPRVAAFKGEAAITSALLELTAGKPNKVYLVSGHGEPDLSGNDFRAITELLKRQNIQTAPLNLLTGDKVPADASSLLINGPKYDYSELEIKLINDFWEKKGSLLICLNPFAKTPRLTAWLAAQGVLPQDDRILAKASFMSMNEQTGLPEFTKGTTQNAAFVIPDNNSPITKDLTGVSKQLLGATQSLQLDTAKSRILQVRLTPLLEAIEDEWGETNLTEDISKAEPDEKDHKQPPPLVMAASVEKGAMEDPRVKVETARMIVVGNAEFLGDKEYRTSEGVTADLTINALNWLLSHEEAICIPPKERKSVTLSLSTEQLRNIAITVMFIIPGGVALLGLVTWLSRRS